MTLLTIGTFDVPHVGHAAFLRRCERLCPDVVVGVNSDAFVQTFKKAPVFEQGERLRLIGSLGYRTMLNDGPGRDLIRAVRPSILAVGSDWLRKDYLSQVAMTVEDFEALDCALVFLPYTADISTTIIRERFA